MKKPTEKVTPIAKLEALLENPVEEKGVALSDGRSRTSWECSCSCKAATERASGTVIVRCPECGLIRDIWRGAERLLPGTYCRWCGHEDLTASTGACADPACHPRRRQKAR